MLSRSKPRQWIRPCLGRLCPYKPEEEPEIYRSTTPEQFGRDVMQNAASAGLDDPSSKAKRSRSRRK